MYDIQKSVDNVITVFMQDSLDHLTGKTGLTLLVSILKSSSFGFSEIHPDINDNGGGYYEITLSDTDCNATGPLVVQVNATGADTCFKVLNVVDSLLMSISEMSIWNMALSKIGITQLIKDPAETTQAAETCRLFYAMVRDQVLRKFNWPFARKTIALVDIGTPPTNWGYRYSYPSDCAKIRCVVVEGKRNPKASERIPYSVIANETNSGKAIVCDMPEAVIEYTARITDANLYTADFVSSLAAALAIEIAMPLTSDQNKKNAVAQELAQTMLLAQTSALSEEQDSQYPESEFISARS